MASNSETIDEWHLHGPTNQEPIPEPVTTLLRSLPKLSAPYPFRTGNTGYIELTSVVSPGTMGRAVDDFGRNVFIVGPFLIFQRYTANTQRYMITSAVKLDSPFHSVDEQTWAQAIALALVKN